MTILDIECYPSKSIHLTDWYYLKRAAHALQCNAMQCNEHKISIQAKVKFHRRKPVDKFQMHTR